MTRFAGEFSPIQLSAGASGGNYSAAAGAVDIGNSFSAQREKAPRFDQLSAEAMRNAADVQTAAFDAEAGAVSNAMAAFGKGVESYNVGKASIEAAKAEAEATKSSAMMGTFGKIASAGLSLIPGLG